MTTIFLSIIWFFMSFLIWFAIDAAVIMGLVRFIGDEEVGYWLALCMGGFATITIVGVGGTVIEQGMPAFFGLVAAVGFVLSLLVWILAEVKPGRALLIGSLFIVYKFAVGFLFALGR